ncbi:unnamed protein product [Bursaphelenchus okinawaensis]|uniref:Uncharacterized protein n=1 Tax=Bursaphelenchus okinawaensis TaxID=465554 RepID=A0A811LND1_9BILA|nr:unnamed protein product [Bursaphelenchus okinawaensis]CAG9124427.1 unnamed protein product [Bursaphelenchus okinawaensis]
MGNKKQKNKKMDGSRWNCGEDNGKKGEVWKECSQPECYTPSKFACSWKEVYICQIFLSPRASNYMSHFGSNLNTIGLGRSRRRQNIVQQLYQSNVISRPVVTKTWFVDTPVQDEYIKLHKLVFGKLDTEYCSGGWSYLTPVSGAFWMFDGYEFYFYSLRKAKKYRLMFSEKTYTGVSTQHISQLVHDNVIISNPRNKMFYYLPNATDNIMLNVNQSEEGMTNWSGDMLSN